MEDGGFDVQELRRAQYAAAVDVSELKSEWELLEPVRSELEAWKAALRIDARNRLAKKAAGDESPLTPGQVVGQKIFHIHVDRPLEKERTTTTLHRQFYEREYVRVTKLIKEVKLPATVETLWRGKVLPDGQRLEIGKGPLVPSLDLSALGKDASGQIGPGIVAEGANAAKPPREDGEVSQGNGGLGRRKSSKKLFKSLSNPFKDFIQPPQSGQEPSSTQQLQDPEEMKPKLPKRRSGLRWCFAAPFTQAGDTPQWHRTQPNVEMLSQSSNQNSLPGPLPSGGDPASKNTDAGIRSLQNSHKDENNAMAAQNSRSKAGATTEGPGGGNGRAKSPHESAVRAALQAGAADESQHETFTQLEEKAVTIETTERFLEHRFYQREYIILVIYKGEKLLPQYYETLSRERYLLPEKGVAAASAPS